MLPGPIPKGRSSRLWQDLVQTSLARTTALKPTEIAVSRPSISQVPLGRCLNLIRYIIMARPGRSTTARGHQDRDNRTRIVRKLQLLSHDGADEQQVLG